MKWNIYIYSQVPSSKLYTFAESEKFKVCHQDGIHQVFHEFWIMMFPLKELSQVKYCIGGWIKKQFVSVAIWSILKYRNLSQFEDFEVVQAAINNEGSRWFPS